MKFKKAITILVILIAVFSLAATLAGILSDQGPGEYEYESIRGENVTIYGKGFYKHMSSDVAIQGISQDYVTLFMGIPFLFISLYFSRKDTLKGKIMLSGTVGYFALTYIFYLCMAMYNELFLLWVLLASLSFYTFILTILSFGLTDLRPYFGSKVPVRKVGIFLIITSLLIAFLWLSVIVPPLLDGSIYPPELEHYTTLIVQGLDLSILLPGAFLSGLLFIKNRPIGYLIAPIYNVFLCLLMASLTAKIVGMSLVGVDPGPAIVIIPLIDAVAIILAYLTLKNIDEEKYKEKNNHYPEI
ncbi:MAG: hypothetical protein ACOCZJ_01615 [Thermoplasmatota archaeon]